MIQLVKDFFQIIPTDKDICSLMQFSLMKGVGGDTFKKLLYHFETLENIRSVSQKDLLQIKGIGQITARNIMNGLKIVVEDEFKHAEKDRIKIISIFDKEYPASLLELYDPPLVIFVKGEIKNEDKLSIGIVGSRGPTTYGKFQAERFSFHLASSGFTVVSGLAYGIDTFAHKGALHGEGRTLAVIGNGFQHCYPEQNRELSEKIIDNGAIITEYLYKTPPIGKNFPRRNRIVAALSLGVLVVEARVNSGSLITTRHALELGREIFALPGPVNSPESEGTHKLITEGARLVQKPEDILEELGELEVLLKPVMREVASQQKQNLNEDEVSIVGLLGASPIHFDAVFNKLNFDVSELLSFLSLLEIKGMIKSHPGQFFSKV
ncbi:MAG: DNA-protecting protein DprA [Planctomycetota bacterium]|nr:MAG: DNA-protecting protein DprA [Planctomycetota bacterium]